MTHSPVPVHAAPPRASFWEKLGPGGLASLLLALLAAGAGLGIPVLFRLRRVLREARPGLPGAGDAILVLGRRLEGDACTEVFQARLAHGAALWRQGLAPRVVVAGGLTGDARRSEAEAGRAWLQAEGLPPEALLVEDRSQHTLENLFNVRRTAQAEGWRTLLLVSDPLHMARASANARNLGLDVVCCPAPGCPPSPGRPGWWSRALREAFLLHWYHLGLAYSRLIRSRRQLARVT